ncbi:MAG: DUF5939 domain-containing protein [Fidelibacterota bacterium]
MTFGINEDVLEEKLEKLERARTWSPRVIAKLESFIRSGNDFLLFRINPIRFSKEKEISEEESIILFLFGRKVGLFRMEWQLLCNRCGDVVESFSSLEIVDSEFFCNMCAFDGEASMDDMVEVSFTVSPQVRRIRCHDPDSLSAEDYFLKYRISQNALVEDGRKLVDMMIDSGRLLTFLEVGETRDFEVEVTPGFLGTSFGLSFQVEGKTEEKVQSFSHRIVKKPERHIESLAPGKLSLRLENASPDRLPVAIFSFPSPPSGPHFEPFLSGKKLLTTQTYRDLFESDRVATNDGISIRDITFVFTDLKGSTALYEKIGDLKAFDLVRQHFDYLREAINRNHGAIVKTIGDAVMASFYSPVDAVEAALGMLERIERFNEEYGEKILILKIGMHRGHSIAVTLNDRLDYFGQTVNIASRVQQLADADEIYLTDDVFRFPDVREKLQELHIEAHTAKLKGITTDIQVYRL